MTTLEDVRTSWNAYGKRDPLWAILTDENKQHGGWDPEQFFATGYTDVSHYLDIVHSLVDRSWCQHDALDFGCGVGRLSQALARSFDLVTGVDIAPSMVEQANAYNRFPNRVSYLLNDPPSLSFLDDNAFDFILSLITLQHDEPVYQYAYLQQFMRVLRPGGVLVFHAMVECPVAIIHAVGSAERPVMEMHGISPTRALNLLRSAGGHVLDVRYNRAQSEWSTAWTALDYYIQKEA